MRPAPKIGARERLMATAVLSVLLHAVLILGVAFTAEEAAPIVPTLDVILTQTRSEKAPEQADFIAQANNIGGGDKDIALRPREQQVARELQPTPGMAPRKLIAQAPPPEPEPQAKVITSMQGSQPLPPPREQKPKASEPLPMGRELQRMDLDIANKLAERDRARQLYAKRPKRKFVSASTAENEFAAYLAAWAKRVEQVGNANYPIEAQRRRISGRVLVTVVINRRGQVVGMTLNQSSGQRILDDAVDRIVKLAQPFPPLPSSAERVDELYVTRTWDFLNGDFATRYAEDNPATE